MAVRRSAPLLEYRAAFRFNLRALVDLPPGRFRDEDADPVMKLRDYLARTDRTGPSRFSDGTFPIVYMG